ncbi:hypothetical protein ACFS32_15220 [Novosphingobium pokkalii]|uniref:hypothetical protein n=1 Tax=Novosphingobium pokkalii TaxID=1770194 RepID=UPI00362831C1
MNEEDLKQTMLLGLSGHETKMNSYFDPSNEDGPRCIMLSHSKRYKVIDAQANSHDIPDALILEIVGEDVNAADKGAFTLTLDKSMVHVENN